MPGQNFPDAADVALTPRFTVEYLEYVYMAALYVCVCVCVCVRVYDCFRYQL